MVICHEYDLIFFEFPRAASTAIAWLLKDHYGGTQSIVGGTSHHAEVPAGCEDYFFFTSIRNPYSRVYSHYRWKCAKRNLRLSFEQYLRNTNDTLRHYFGDTRFDAVVRFEELPESIFSLLRSRGMTTDAKLGRHGISTGVGWKKAYTQKLADLVYRASEGEFQTYGYERDSWRKE